MRTLAAVENIFFLILIAIVGLVRWIAQAAENKRNTDAAKRASPPPNAPAPRAPSTTEEERIRRFMEALGVPASTPPPPKPQPRQITPRKPRAQKKVQPVDPFPKPWTWKPEPVVVVEPPNVELSAEPVIPKPPPAPASPILPSAVSMEEFGVQMSEQPVTAKQVRSNVSSWSARLATHQGMQEAIILREIFGPPKGLRA